MFFDQSPEYHIFKEAQNGIGKICGNQSDEKRHQDIVDFPEKGADGGIVGNDIRNHTNQ